VDGLWFDADLVILRAESRIFRVFTSVLKELKSPLFATMFALPQPASAEKIEGVHVVDMQDDPADLEVFLRAVFDSNFFARPKKAGVDVILAVLRLAYKYNVDFLRRRALEHFDDMFCTRIEDFVPGRALSAVIRLGKIQPFLDEHFKTIKVLVDVGALWMLPNAYYMLTSFGLKPILHSVMWNAVGASEKDNALRIFSSEFRLQLLAPALSMLSMDSPCMTTADCNDARLTTIRTNQWDCSMGVLEDWDETDYRGEELRNRGLCESCLLEAKDAYTEGKQKF
ncbi:hypothetical protein C8R45DRAFT_831769, partial [Mycena sanguinolenta]